MFREFLEAAVGMSDAELNEAVGDSELTMREQEARHAALLAVADARQIYRADGHHSLKGYLRATCNHSIGEAVRRRKVAAVVEAVPEVGEALAAAGSASRRSSSSPGSRGTRGSGNTCRPLRRSCSNAPNTSHTTISVATSTSS